MNIPLDKQAHFLGGYALAISIGLFYPLFGLVAALAAGILKELYDYYHPATHTCDVNDLVATVAGGLVAYVFIMFTQ